MSDDILKMAENVVADDDALFEDYDEVIEGLVKEIKRLRVKSIKEQLATKYIEIARWRQIAIEERARVLYFAHAGDDMYDMACLEESEHHKDRHMREAANELQLESSNLSPKDCCP